MKVVSPLDLQAQRAQNAADPTTAQDVATKAYVDARVAGAAVLAAARELANSNFGGL